MKLKYFLRGLASGIVITTLILTISYRNKMADISEQEVAITEEATLTPEVTKTPKEEVTVTPEATQEPTMTLEATQEPTMTPEATQEPTATPEPTQEPTVTPEPTPEPTKAPAEVSTEKKVLTITSGMWSDRVARELQAMGVVENAADFDKYLIQNGYADKIVVGTFEIQVGASYDEIARIITSK